MDLPLRILTEAEANALAYDRVPAANLIVFDINTGHESYASYVEKQREAAVLGLEVVPRLFHGKITAAEEVLEFLNRVSILGGQTIEGIVIKNYARFGQDKKVLIGKYVSEAFKETHSKEWRADNPGKQDVINMLIATLKTSARWAKGVQHAREAGLLDDSPKDIGLLFKEVQNDIEKEEIDFIKQKLYDWCRRDILRGVMGGFPEWYKEELVKRQFTQ